MGVHHAIVGVHPAHMTNAPALFEEFAAKHMTAARG
jgi:hypothetical protein